MSEKDLLPVEKDFSLAVRVAKEAGRFAVKYGAIGYLFHSSVYGYGILAQNYSMQESAIEHMNATAGVSVVGVGVMVGATLLHERIMTARPED